MRRSFRWLVRLGSFAMVLFATVRSPVVAQEAQEGRGGRGTRQPTIAETPARTPRWQGRGGFNNSQSAAENTLNGEPTESVALMLWILTVGEPKQPPADELSANLEERVSNPPHTFRSVGQIRELVGQLKVAGMLRNSREFRVVTLDGQSATVQRGNNQPRIIATANSPGGRMNSIQYEPVGTVVEMGSQIDADRNIQASVRISESYLEKSEDVMLSEPVDGSPTFADVVATRQFNTATSLKDNTAVLLQSAVSDSSNGAGTEIELIFLSASIVRASE